MPQLQAIAMTAMKSTILNWCDEARIGVRGIEHDRVWMLVDADGRFISQRERGEMGLLSVYWRHDSWWAQRRDNGDSIRLSLSEQRRSVRIWNDTVSARAAHEMCNQWFSALLQQPVMAVFMDEQAMRWADPAYTTQQEPVSFTDGFPLLMISEASLLELNARLAQKSIAPVSMAQFRPNLVVSDCPAFAEDGWRTLRIGEVEFRCVKPCSRCVLTTRDPDTLLLHPDQEPLRTLAQFRRQDGGVMFGQNVIVQRPGLIRCGMPVSILE